MGNPRPPFHLWPVQHFDPRYGYAWYCGDGRIVSHIVVARGTEAAAHAYHDFESAVLRDHEAEIAQCGGIFVVHDWRAMETYESGARRVWQERMVARPKGYLRGSTVCLLRASSLLRMAVQAANVVASLSHSARVELSTDLDAALRAQGLRGPP